MHAGIFFHQQWFRIYPLTQHAGVIKKGLVGDSKPFYWKEGSSKTFFFQTPTKDDDIPFPYHPCMVHLPTFTIKINHMDCIGFHMTVASFFGHLNMNIRQGQMRQLWREERCCGGHGDSNQFSVSMLQHQLFGWWFQRIFIFTPRIGEDSQFDYSNIFQRGWNHQQVIHIMYNVHLPDFSLEEYRNGPWFQNSTKKEPSFKTLKSSNITQHK